MLTTRPLHGHSPQLLSELGTAELFVLSSLRLWFLSHCDREHEYPDWRQAFATAHISKLGTWSFDRLCFIVGTTPLRSLDVHWLHCGRIGEYESCLLQVIGSLQNNQAAAAERALLQWCPPAAVRVALEVGHAVAVALESHGLRMPIRTQATFRPRTTTVPASVGSSLLH